MAVSQIEEKILGRLAKETGPSNALLSASLYQVLGLSILLSRKLVKARKLRRLDTSRETKSLQLYHHIIWLAREGLSITEVYILPYCSDGEQGPECRVMAAKLRASFYHVFCLFHNQPPLSQVSSRSNESATSPSSTVTPKPGNSQTRQSPGRSPTADSKRRKGKTALRDPIPSMTSDTSYITNPYAPGPAQTPPPAGPPPPIPTEGRRTPARLPGLAPINISPARAAASFLLPPIDFVPLAKGHFETAQHLANGLLSPAHALRLSVSLEHAAFSWDCEKDHSRSRHLAKRAIQRVYASNEGLDDDEFADASSLVQALGGVLNRGRNEPSRQPSREQVASPNQRVNRAPQGPTIDRTIAVSPPSRRNQTQSPGQLRSIMRTPDRLSTVPEVESTETSGEGQEGLAQTTAQTSISPPTSRLSSRSRQRGTSSATSDKGSKRRAVEQAEEQSRSRSRRGSPSVGSGGGGGGSQSRSRQPTPQEGYVATPRLRSSRERNSNG